MMRVSCLFFLWLGTANIEGDLGASTKIVLALPLGIEGSMVTTQDRACSSPGNWGFDSYLWSCNSTDLKRRKFLQWQRVNAYGFSEFYVLFFSGLRDMSPCNGSGCAHTIRCLSLLILRREDRGNPLRIIWYSELVYSVGSCKLVLHLDCNFRLMFHMLMAWGRVGWVPNNCLFSSGSIGC